MKPSKHLSVIIPAYNEALRIGPSLQRVWDYLRARYGAGGFEIIVVEMDRAIARSLSWNSSGTARWR